MNIVATLDLWIALIVMLIVSTMLLLLTDRVLNKASFRTKQIFAAVVVVTIFIFGLFLYDSHFLLTLLPFQSVVLYGNFSLPLSAILAAVLWKVKQIPPWRRKIAIVCCLSFGAYLNFASITSKPPHCANLWDDNVCLQSSRLTCSPAAAATILMHHGIKSNEEEMANLCLTDKRGTPLHGLYRGLRIKTKPTAYSIQTGSTNLTKLTNNISMPAILNVELTRRVANSDPRYAKKWGWKVGIPHTVVLFGIDSKQRVDIGDPGVGREFWGVQALRDLWHGEYITLTKKQ